MTWNSLCKWIVCFQIHTVSVSQMLGLNAYTIMHSLQPNILIISGIWLYPFKVLFHLRFCDFKVRYMRKKKEIDASAGLWKTIVLSNLASEQI